MQNSIIIVFILLVIFVLVVGTVVAMMICQNKNEEDQIDMDNFERFHEIDMAIDRAIKNEDFEILYQPVFCIETEEIVACEALLRLNDDELGTLLPDSFIPVAEKTGKILELGNAVLNRVCQFIKNSNLQDTSISFVEVNLSIMECLQSDLPDRIANLLDVYGISHDFLSLEIKESAISLKNYSIQENINKLHEMGISMTLDDYGTGNSTLAYVMTLPFRGVKIDRTMLWRAMKNPSVMYALCANIATLKDMDTKIMIEGAESEEIVEKLKSLKVDYVQGFYFATPMTDNELIDFMSKN